MCSFRHDNSVCVKSDSSNTRDTCVRQCAVLVNDKLLLPRIYSSRILPESIRYLLNRNNIHMYYSPIANSPYRVRALSLFPRSILFPFFPRAFSFSPIKVTETRHFDEPSHRRAAILTATTLIRSAVCKFRHTVNKRKIQHTHDRRPATVKSDREIRLADEIRPQSCY